MSERAPDSRSAPSALGPAVAGTWYPAEFEVLANQIDGFLREAERDSGSEQQGETAMLVAPHAGYVYSGPVAAHGFLQVRGRRFDRVILLGPSHYSAFPGGALPSSSIYRTPLGEVPIDRDAISMLERQPGLRIDERPFRPEHSLEAEIPFLQRCLAPGWRLLPVLLGAGGSAASAGQVAEALRPLLGKGTLVVVSSDFTHYGPRFDYVPFERDVAGKIERLDMGAVERILARDARGFEDYLERTGATICGRRAISVLLRLEPEGLTGRLAAYDTSGRITGSWGHSVSYASLVFQHSDRPRPCPS